MIETPWADSLFETMTLDQKIGQLFSVAAYSNKGDTHKEEILELIQKYHIGGLTFFQGGPHRQAKLTNCLLYTSDAADDSLRVDLGGRRIIKKIRSLSPA